jgi:ribosomal protein S13
MLTFKEIELSFRRPSVAWALSKVTGIGYQRASYVLSTIGIGFTFAVTDLNFYNFELSCILLKDNYITDERLVKMNEQRMKFLERNKVIRGIRFFAGLPIHGQRTHSNSKTSELNKRIV